jgi:hypothetical protein
VVAVVVAQTLAQVVVQVAIVTTPNLLHQQEH